MAAKLIRFWISDSNTSWLSKFTQFALNMTSTKKRAVEHKASLQSLKDTDPEFYQFLEKEGRELLNFNPDEISGKYTGKVNT